MKKRTQEGVKTFACNDTLTKNTINLMYRIKRYARQRIVLLLLILL